MDPCPPFLNPSLSMDPLTSTTLPPAENSRLGYLDATRAFALILGVVFHASLSFVPTFMGWAVQDISTSAWVSTFITVSHSFRMELFFLLAGFFGHATFHRKGAGEFVRTRLLRIGVPFIVGWFILRPLVVSGWIMGSASLRGDYDFWTGIQSGFATLRTLPTGLFTGTHLWFLYYLALITSLLLVFRTLLTKTGTPYDVLTRQADSFIAWLVNSWLCLPLLAAPTAGALWFMRFWAMDTPDQTLKPHGPVIVVYGGFFLLGWMLSRQRELISRFARLTPPRWLIASVGIAGTLTLSKFQFDPGHPHHVAAHLGFVMSYALMMWSLVFLALGFFKKFCAQPNPIVRYLADSSYWMYLIHLPVVVWLQVAVAEVQLPWWLKLAFITTTTIALSLISYHLFVRFTWIGSLLNGRRRDQKGILSQPRTALATNAPRECGGLSSH